MSDHLVTTHPLQRMAEQLAQATARRDSRVLNQWLCGEGLPRLSREGELPHEVLWELVCHWWQPDPLQLHAFMQLVCDALDACVSSVKAQLACFADGTTGQPVSPLSGGEFAQPFVDDTTSPGYCRSLFSLCALLPQHEDVFGRLDNLDTFKALGSTALLHAGVVESLQRALIEQQTDDRLLARRWQVDFDLAISLVGSNHWRESAGQLLASWRAMVLACASESVQAQVNRPELLSALQRTAHLAGQWPQHDVAVDALLAHMLAHLPLIQGGPVTTWCAAVQQTTLSIRVKSVAHDLWPTPGRLDAWVASAPALHSIWRKLGRAGRDAVRQCAELAQPQALGALQFSWVQARLPKEWTDGMVKLLREHVPALRVPGLPPADYRRLQAEDQRADHRLPSDSAEPNGSRSNHAHFVATQNSVANIKRLLARHQRDKAQRRADDLLNRQAKDGTPSALQSKTAANLATAFAEAGHLLAAKTLWLRAIDLNTDDSVARCGLAEVLKELGDLAAARAQYENTVQSHPQNVVARNGLAEVLKELGDLAAARAQYEDTLQSHPQNVVARNGLANVLRRMGAFTEAKALLVNWAQSRGRQRLLDGVVYALACLPDAGDESLQVLWSLQADSTLTNKDRTRLDALSACMTLKRRQRTSLLAEAPPDVPPLLRGWFDVVRAHQRLQYQVPVPASQQTTQLELLGWAKDKVRQLLDQLAAGDDAANDVLFDLEVDALLAA